MLVEVNAIQIELTQLLEFQSRTIIVEGDSEFIKVGYHQGTFSLFPSCSSDGKESNVAKKKKKQRKNGSFSLGVIFLHSFTDVNGAQGNQLRMITFVCILGVKKV